MKPIRLSLTWLLLIASVLFSHAAAMEWQQLDKMRMAMQQMDYRGEFLHRRGDQTHVYAVVHKFENGEATELLKQLDGDMVEILRRGKEVTCYFPPKSKAALNHGVPAGPFSQASALKLDAIAHQYTAKSLGQERVAGFEADIIELSAGDDRYRHRFWLEKDSHLLLQSEILDSRGQILEQFRFTRLELGVAITSEELVPSLASEENARSQTDYKPELASGTDQGFSSQLRWLPDGYELTYAERKQSPEHWQEQRTYSDGLSTFSIFVDGGKAAVGQSALARMGATTALMLAVGDVAVTVIGEVPKQTAQRIGRGLYLAQ